MSKHTPGGPWASSFRDKWGTARYVAQAESAPYTPNYSDVAIQEANARLIAAAPELLEALRNLVEASDAMRGTYEQIDARGYDEDNLLLHDKWAEDFLAERTDAARAAIAKATGESA